MRLLVLLLCCASALAVELEYEVANPKRVVAVLGNRMPEGVTLAVKGDRKFTVNVADKKKVATVKKLICVGRVRFHRVADAQGRNQALQIPPAKGIKLAHVAVDGKVFCARKPTPVEGTECEQAVAHRELGLGDTWTVVFRIKKAAQARMVTLTKGARHVAIEVDGRIYSAPMLRHVLSDSAQISGWPRERCEWLAALTKSGPLPAQPKLVAER